MSVKAEIHMKTIVKYLALLLATISLVACSTIFERYPVNLKTLVWLEREGIFDPEVPTSKVHELLSKGLYHKDPEILRCSISAIVLYSNVTSHDRLKELTLPVDRRLDEIPGLYDLFTGMWDKGWEEAGGVVPDVQPPKDSYDRVMNKTGCLAGDPLWTSVAYPMSYLFPGDEKVNDIIWKRLRQREDPRVLLEALFEGKFNYPRDQQFRIDVLTNPETNLQNAKLAARSLGEFPADSGLEALVRVLEEDILPVVPPKMTIVEAMMKYEAEAVPHIALMRKMLNSARAYNAEARDRKKTLQERFTQFEEEYAEELENPSG